MVIMGEVLYAWMAGNMDHYNGRAYRAEILRNASLDADAEREDS